MSLLTPLALIGLLLAIPIILLYMLRLRRREVVVSTTFLWQQIVQDTEANTPWQRLRRNLLLFLQLLILLLMVLALARPFMIVPAVSTGQIELLLDASASMNARDVNGGSRFEEAKRQALSIVDTLSAGDTMTIIRVADVPDVIAARTNDPLILRNAINNAQPSRAEADWVAALTLAAADAVDSSNFDLVIIGDGGLGNASGLPGVPGTIRYLPIGTSDSNLAISALATRALPGQRPQLFGQITNYGAQDTEIIFDLRVDGDLFTAERYTIPAGSNLPIVSEALPDTFSVLQAGLTLPSDTTAQDYLAEDNSAWAVASGTGAGRALVLSETSNRFLEQVLRSLATMQAFQGDVTRPLPATPYDLYIFDGWLPATLPEGDLLIINPPRSTSLFTLGAESTATGNPQVRRSDPRMAFVDFGDVSVLKFRPVTTNWGDALITVQGGPLLVAGEVDGRQVAILTFDLRESDLPLQITWPVLMANLLNWFTPQAAVNVPDGLRVGESLPIRPPFEATEVRITLPDGSQESLPVDRQTLVFADTDQPGIYTAEILEGETVRQTASFAVNLFAPGESNITPQSAINLSGLAILAAEREEVGQQEFWPWVALLALLVLMIEWYVYWRRLQVRTIFRPTLQPRRA